MDDNKKGTRDKNVDYQIATPDYGELIVEMVHNISDTWILEQIFRYIMNMTKEG